MARITFYEKTGCINNTKQKALLVQAGYELDAFNLLTEPWTAERLCAFFGELPVASWFNRSAPRIKSGEIKPELLTADKALQLMLKEPLLIRRPLIEFDGKSRVGFDQKTEEWLGLGINKVSPKADLETCPKTQDQASCVTQN